MKTLVITPTLGESRWLDATVASVAQVPDARHVLVAPAARVEGLRRRFSCAEAIPEPAGGRGLYAAINAAATIDANWDALTYINDDDLLLPGIRQVLAAMGARTGAAIGYGQVRLIDAEGRRLGAIPVSPWPGLNRLLYAQRIEPVYQHGTVINRAAWERLGGFDESYRLCGDSELLARGCCTGIPFVRVGAAVAAFRLRPGQLTKQRPAMLDERARVDRTLGLPAAPLTARHHAARFAFRLANLPAYAGRIVRFGWRRFDDVLAAGG